MIAASVRIAAMGGDGRGVWTFLGQPKNRALLGWVGSGLAAAAAGLWAVVTFLSAPPSAPSRLRAASSIVGGHDASHNTLTINGAAGGASSACADAGSK